MSASPFRSIVLIAVTAALLFTAGAVAADKCSRCGCGQKLTKSYRPVVTFKKCTFQCWDYKTVCKDVFVPTATCCKTCGCGARVRCHCPGRPTTVSVPVAVPHKRRECVRMVPVVTWVVESRCEDCYSKTASSSTSR